MTMSEEDIEYEMIETVWSRPDGMLMVMGDGVEESEFFSLALYEMGTKKFRHVATVHSSSLFYTVALVDEMEYSERITWDAALKILEADGAYPITFDNG